MLSLIRLKCWTPCENLSTPPVNEWDFIINENLSREENKIPIFIRDILQIDEMQNPNKKN